MHVKFQGFKFLDGVQDEFTTSLSSNLCILLIPIARQVYPSIFNINLLHDYTCSFSLMHFGIGSSVGVGQKLLTMIRYHPFARANKYSGMKRTKFFS